jgi:hypothetical protein
MTIIRKPIEGTSRQRVIMNNGKELQRQFVYLRPVSWEALTALARQQGTSGSHVIERLILLATLSNRARNEAG